MKISLICYVTTFRNEGQWDFKLFYTECIVDYSNFFLNLFAFILLTSTLVPGINYFVFITHPLHQLQVRKRNSSSCYMIETYNTRHRFPCY